MSFYLKKWTAKWTAIKGSGSIRYSPDYPPQPCAIPQSLTELREDPFPNRLHDIG